MDFKQTQKTQQSISIIYTGLDSSSNKSHLLKMYCKITNIAYTVNGGKMTGDEIFVKVATLPVLALMLSSMLCLCSIILVDHLNAKSYEDELHKH